MISPADRYANALRLVSEWRKTEVGDTAYGRNGHPKRGWALWVESGTYYTAKKVSPSKFGGHEYAIGRGMGECRCGCYMGQTQSAGPVDPFGACPMNPRRRGRA